MRWVHAMHARRIPATLRPSIPARTLGEDARARDAAQWRGGVVGRGVVLAVVDNQVSPIHQAALARRDGALAVDGVRGIVVQVEGVLVADEREVPDRRLCVGWEARRAGRVKRWDETGGHPRTKRLLLLTTRTEEPQLVSGTVWAQPAPPSLMPFSSKEVSG